MTASELLSLRQFLTSVGMHAVLFLAAFFLFLNRPLPPSPPITVDLQYPQSKTQPQVRSLGHPKPAHAQSVPTESRRHHNAVRLDDLGVKIDTSQAAEPPAESADPYAPGAPGGWDLENTNPKIARFNQYVYTVVQRQLDLESRWLQNRLQGTVKMRIWFDERGNYLEARTGFQAIDEQFQRIVKRALRQAFLMPVPKQALYSDRTFYIDREVFVRGSI